MKCKSILDITTEGSLKVKRRTIIYNTQSHVQDQREIKEAPPTLQDIGQTTFDELQEFYKIIEDDDTRINPIDGRITTKNAGYSCVFFSRAYKNAAIASL